MNSTLLVARRELQAQLRSKALVVSTIVMAVIILAAGVLGRFLLDDESADEEFAATVGVTESAMPLADTLTAAGITVRQLDGDPETILEGEEDLNALITGTPDSPEILALETAEHLDVITSVTQSAATAFIIGEQLGDAEAADVLAAIGQTQQIMPEFVGGTEFDPVVFTVGALTAGLVYGVIAFGIAMLATGVVEEKSSRVVEILLATIKPRNLLLGKFLGIGAAILSMVAIYVIALVAAGSIAGLLPEINIGRYIPMLIVWVLLGYIIYASVTGGLAATVSRQEDIGAITGPMVFCPSFRSTSRSSTSPTIPIRRSPRSSATSRSSARSSCRSGRRSPTFPSSTSSSPSPSASRRSRSWRHSPARSTSAPSSTRARA